MSTTDIVLLAIALAMDCFAVSVTIGVTLKKWKNTDILPTAILFGLFQAAMPIAGWAATNSFSYQISTYGHWIAFALLTFIGGRMIWQAIGTNNKSEPTFQPHKTTTKLLLAVATSIDALAVGITFAATGRQTIDSLAEPVTIIGLTSFLLSLIGHALGITIGTVVTRIIKPDILGGIILIAIGIKTLISHLTEKT